MGALAADFYTRTGYMPLANPHDQPERSKVQFTDPEREALVRYVASLGGGPPVPRPDPSAGSVAAGRELFTDHCAGCHQAVAEGGILTGAKAPPLDRASPVEIAEAVRIGPVPHAALLDHRDQRRRAELDHRLRAVRQEPARRRRVGLNHLGPFPEGMVTWFIGALVLVATCILIGERVRR